MEGKEIIKMVLKEVDLKAPTFANKIGVKYQRISDIQRGVTKKISGELAFLIIKEYPQFDYTWLISGEGEMFKKEHIKQEINDPNISTLISMLNDSNNTIKEKDKIIKEKDDRMIKLNNAVNYFQNLCNKYSVPFDIKEAEKGA